MCVASETYCGVTRVNNVVVQVDEAPWPFATQNRENIYAFWREKQKSHPHFYDGQVHVMTSWEIRGAQTNAAAFVGNLCRTNFASFLYWKVSDAHSQKTISHRHSFWVSGPLGSQTYLVLQGRRQHDPLRSDPCAPPASRAPRSSEWHLN